MSKINLNKNDLGIEQNKDFFLKNHKNLYSKHNKFFLFYELCQLSIMLFILHLMCGVFLVENNFFDNLMLFFMSFITWIILYSSISKMSNHIMNNFIHSLERKIPFRKERLAKYLENMEPFYSVLLKNEIISAEMMLNLENYKETKKLDESVIINNEVYMKFTREYEEFHYFIKNNFYG